MNELGNLPETLATLPPVVVVCGHYGVGKTNFALNFALDAAASGAQVTLVDLDIVNPYFRSSDYRALLAERAVELVCPQSAGTTLDAPMLSVAIDDAIKAAQQEKNRLCIIDAGGDDVGATALGRYANTITEAPYAMLYVVNASRELTKEPQDAAALLPEMEAASHLHATHVVNNTHLMDATDEAVVKRGISFARDVAQLLNLPLACTTIALMEDADDTEGLTSASTALKQLVKSNTLACENPYFVRIYVRKPWD